MGETGENPRALSIHNGERTAMLQAGIVGKQVNVNQFQN